MSGSMVVRTLFRQRPHFVQLRAFHSSPRRLEHFLDVNPQTFQKAISNKEKVILVDFYANWCGPCKMLSPVLEKLTSDPDVQSGSGKPLDLVTVDTDVERDLAQLYGIRSLPTVIAFKEGKPVSQFMGALPEPGVRRFIDSL